MKKHFYSHGKIILTGEYVVLDGAWAIVLSSRKGQLLEVQKMNNTHLHWKSHDENGNIWFESILNSSLEITYSTDWKIAITLKHLLLQAKKLNKDTSSKCRGALVNTYLEFPRSWGLGSSATLLSNLSRWLEIEPHVLSDKTFGGSGCDIACTFSGQSILYQLQRSKRYVLTFPFNPSFSEEIFFLPLNKKQNTRSAISNYNSKKKCLETIERLSKISLDIQDCQNLEYFKELLNEHEYLVANILGTLSLKERLFKNYPSTIKSLGAWGGDLALVIRTDNMYSYFKNKGYSTIISFKELILNEK